MSPPDTMLKRISSDDWELFRQVRLRALEDAPYAYSSTHEDWSVAPESRWRARLAEVPSNWIGFLEDQPQGMVSVTGNNAAHEADLISMWVGPEARGKGLADALVQAAIAQARAQGATALMLHVYEANARAHGLYRRHGFELTGMTERSPDGKRLENVMRCRLL